MSSTDKAYNEICPRFDRDLIFKVKESITDNIYLSVGRMRTSIWSTTSLKELTSYTNVRSTTSA